jgi:hypothetical protein
MENTQAVVFLKGYMVDKQPEVKQAFIDLLSLGIKAEAEVAELQEKIRVLEEKGKECQ